MEDKDKLYQSLILILKLFKNRPYHLAKYLIDNEALDDRFVRKIINSKNKLNNKIDNIYFKDISKLNEYFNSIIEDTREKTQEQILLDLNIKLDNLINEEKYEEAICPCFCAVTQIGSPNHHRGSRTFSRSDIEKTSP